MKISYENPMVELKILLDTLAGTDGASSVDGAFIVVTKSEMSVIVKNTGAKELFPSYFNRQAVRKQQLAVKMEESRKATNSPTITPEALQEQFDIQSRLERQMRTLEDEVPTELRSASGVVVKVAMTA